MKTLLLTLALLSLQDKQKLAWNPKAGLKLKCALMLKQSISGKGSASIEGESKFEIGENGSVKIVVVRMKGDEARGKDKAEFVYEAGMEPVVTSENESALRQSKELVAKFAGEHRGTISASGALTIETDEHLPALLTGFIEANFSESPLGMGDTWSAKEEIPLPGPDFKGTMKYQLEKIESGVARISLTTEEGNENRRAKGSGVMTFSSAEGVVTSLTFRLEFFEKDQSVGFYEQSTTITVEK